MMRTLEVKVGDTRMTVPAETGDAELDELSATWQRLVGELKEDETRLQELEEKMKAARDEQRERIAAAMIAGKSAGKAKEATDVAELEKRSEELVEVIASRVRALQRVGAAIITSVSEKAPTLADRLEQELRDEFARWREDLGPLESRSQRLAELAALRTWASASAKGHARKAVNVTDLVVRDLVRHDGSPYGVGAVLAALRGLGQPVEARVRKTMDELAAEGLERRRLAKERDEAFEEKARGVAETLPKSPAAA